MTTASPTPLAFSSLGNGRLPRQSRQPVRPAFNSLRTASRRHSPLSLGDGEGFAADAKPLQDFSIGDSSDEDVPKPMNFSALTKALLEDRKHSRQASPPRPVDQPQRDSRQHHQQSFSATEQYQSRSGTPSAGHVRVTRRSPPPQQAQSQDSPPRIVHLSASKNSSGLRRAASTLERSSHSRGSTPHNDYITPAPHPPGRLSDRSRANSESSPGPAHGHYESIARAAVSSSQRWQHHASSGARTGSAEQAQLDHDSGPRAKAKNAVEASMPNSMRVKRVPMGSGTFLRGAPVRRGIIRRHSEDDQNLDDDELHAAQRDDAEGYHQPPSGLDGHVEVHDFAKAYHAPPPQELDDAHAHESRHRSISRPTRPSSPSSLLHKHDRKPSLQSLHQQPVYRVPAPLPGAINPDQENEPPPTFKRNKPQTASILVSSEKGPTKTEDKPVKVLAQTSHMPGESPKRPPLQALSQNTPLRPAPPPPKMSVLDTATANAGASTVKSKKKRSHVIINNKVFTIRGRIGKGGSSDVYRVMAENDKMFALKKVNLEDCNEETVRGYKGEIDLLKKLENIDRVVRLFDWEINEQKQSLSVLMELGESDLNKLLASRLQPENARLDLSFTRHYWKEMLRCVAAVHAFDIVHSDLKPANFLLVSGRLKLIDFGIANAIDTENTVNVHRETNVGTPNYMSPESLQDTNAGTESRVPGGGSSGAPKLMKLGKPSDIWSLGCILYQMTYGKPPFAHIANQWNRVCAIINPSVQISYSTHGVGGVFVPSSLRRLLQRCLDRDPSRRPSMGHLLGENEAFLNPDMENEGSIPITEGLLGQILLKVVQRCKDPNRGFPSEGELLRTYPKGYMDNIRAGLERG